jgi:hypothetical protein
MNKNLEIGSRVTISTHGSNLGTIQKITGDLFVVQMDGEPGPRLCLKENVFLHEKS